MNFFEAMAAAYDGKAVRRKCWKHEAPQFIKVENTLSHLVKHMPEKSINAVRLSVQIGNSKERPTFPGMLLDGDYKGQIAQFNHEDCSANDWEFAEDDKKEKKSREVPVETK